MEKTKFWKVNDKLYTSKIEAEYAKDLAEKNCYCKGQYVCWNHHCSSPVIEIEIKSDIVKDKSYKKFIDNRLVELKKDLEDKTSDCKKVEEYIKQIEIEKNAI